jgi:hypothetical protein
LEEIFVVGGRSCGRKRCVREINVSRAGDPVHAGDKALTRETPVQRGRVNRFDSIHIYVVHLFTGILKKKIVNV